MILFPLLRLYKVHKGILPAAHAPCHRHRIIELKQTNTIFVGASACRIRRTTGLDTLNALRMVRQIAY